MSQRSRWLVENRQGVILGAVALLLLGVVFVVRPRVMPIVTKPIIASGPTLPPPDDELPEPIASFEPPGPHASELIISAIRSVPDAQQPLVTHRYIGQLIDWDLTLVDVFSLDGTRYFFRFQPSSNPKYFTTISCDLPVKGHEHLAQAHPGSLLRVAGRIQRVDRATIVLEGAEVQ